MQRLHGFLIWVGWGELAVVAFGRRKTKASREEAVLAYPRVVHELPRATGAILVILVVIMSWERQLSLEPLRR